MLIATVVHEQLKVQKKASSSSRPARSLAYQSPFDALPSPRSWNSYCRSPGPSYFWDSSNNSVSKYKNKQASNKNRTTASSKITFRPKIRPAHPRSLNRIFAPKEEQDLLNKIGTAKTISNCIPTIPGNYKESLTRNTSSLQRRHSLSSSSPIRTLQQ